MANVKADLFNFVHYGLGEKLNEHYMRFDCFVDDNRE